MTDLDTMTVPESLDPGAEVFDPVNAWSDASARIYVQVNAIVGGVCQIGYDPAADKHWLRARREGGTAWTPWTSLTLPPQNGG